jgi:hypothetical protein
MEQYIKKLPIELVNKIINYTDVVAFRNGKYINRLLKTDKRYEKINKIPKPMSVGPNKILLRLINFSHEEPHGYLIEYLYTDYIKTTSKFVKRIIDGFDRVYIEKSCIKYIYDVNGNWSKIVYYSM